MICATLKDAKARLNKLVDQAVAGEDVVLMRGSKHVAAIMPISEADLGLSPRLSDAQARRLWRRIDDEIAQNRTVVIKKAEDILK